MPANDSIRSPLDRAVPSDTTTAVVALGCLWGADPVFGGRDGVVRTCVGFAGGTTPDPTHSAIGDHVEAVRVVFAPDQLSYRELLNHFWAHHDPAQTPAKRRYAHALFPQTAAQSDLARATRAAEEERHDDTQRVDIIEKASFSPAALHHQNYKLRRHGALVSAFRARLSSDEAFARSPAATRANAYVAGHRAPNRLDQDRDRLDLPPDAVETLRSLARRHHGWRAYVHSE